MNPKRKLTPLPIAGTGLLSVVGLHLGWGTDAIGVATSGRDSIGQALIVASAMSAPLVFIPPVAWIPVVVSLADLGYTGFSAYFR